MHFPQEVYLWLVSSQLIPNSGEQDEKGVVTIPPNITASFDNGFIVAEIIRRVASNNKKAVPASLATVKSDSSRSAKLTNWNFIWLAFDAIDLKMDARIKELILQGEQALIVEIVRQLYERDEHKPQQNNKTNIRIRASVKAKGQPQFDIKKLNTSKDPQDSDTSLEFLMLLLKTSLGMSVQQILGLFTNQNKFLAQIIVKGINDNFEPIILFYTLLIKHAKKLKTFYEKDARDAEACLNALKPGFISKSEAVVKLAIDLFGKLGNIYAWFREGMCSSSFFLGLKRHPTLRERFWKLFLQIIKNQQVAFFTKYYQNCFQNKVEQIQITTFIIELLSGEEELNDKLTIVGIISSWLDAAVALKEDDIEAQIIAFRFIGCLMEFMPQFIEDNENSLQIFQRKWFMRTLPEFATLLNELIVILERLGSERSSMASKIYQSITFIAKSIGAGDKRDYLVENFLPLISKFPTIPTEYFIQHLKSTQMSNAEFLLVCESIEINESITTLVSVGTSIKGLFLQNPLLNFYLNPMLKQIIQKVIKDEEEGVPFVEKLMEDILHLQASLEIKYKSKVKPQPISFGKNDTSFKANKQQQSSDVIKQKWKEIILNFISNIINEAISLDNNDLKETIKKQLLTCNSYIKFNNFKVGCKTIEDALSKRFGVTKEEQNALFQEYNKKTAADLSESAIRSHKPMSQATVASRLKGPENLTKQFQQIAEKRRQEQEQKKIQELKKKAMQEKKRLSVKKQLQITNLLRGQIGQAQIREEGYLQRLIQEPKELEVISPAEIQERQLESIDIILKKYHKVLRHLFLTYTWTMHNSHTNQKFEDNQQRKQILTIVQLGKLLKDYRLAFLTNQIQINGLVRDINIKLLNKRQVSELDYSAFEQFIIQFCALIMTRSHTITITSTEGKSTSSNNFKNEPLHIIVKEFFTYLKSVFIARGEKTTVFEDVSDLPMSKEQAEEVEAYTKKVQNRPDYILPKGYKKISQNTMQFNHIISHNITAIPQAYAIAIEILDQILAQNPFNIHIIESISERKTIMKVKPTLLANPSGIQKERAMSTYIEKKSPLVDKSFQKRRSSSRGIMAGLQQIPKSERNLGEQAAAVLEDIIEKVEIAKEKEKQKQKKLFSMAKLQEIEKSKQETQLKKAKEKEQQKQAQLQKEKQEQIKRRQKTERFLQEQKLKLAEKRRKQEEEKQRKAEEEEQKQAVKRQNKQKFKAFHQSQVEKIKKIEETALQKIRKQRVQIEQSKEQKEEQRRKLKQQIEQEDRHLIQLRKQTQKNIQTLFESEPIRKTFAKYEPNLRAVFDFLIHNTYVSLTEKKHNSEIIFETWRQFLTSFELTALIHSKDIAFIFKNLTKGKLVTKEYYVGLNFGEFQQALLRIAIKYKTIFNLISEKIKDNLSLSEGQKQANPKKEEKKEQNQFQNINDSTIKDILKENTATKNSIEEYGDIAQVTDRTLLGLIYYLKVPKSKQGQEKRFRDILATKHPSFSHQSERLKEKLSEEYTLEEPTKKALHSKVMIENGAGSQVSAK